MVKILVENNFMVELDFQMMKLGSPGIFCFWQLVQALIANSVDPVQNALSGAVWSWSTVFAKTYMYP